MKLHGQDVIAPAPRDREARASLVVFCVCLLAYGYFVYRGPHHNPDSRLALTYSLVEDGTLYVDRFAGTTLDLAYAGGHFYTDKAPGVSFLLAPLYAGLRLLPGFPGFPVAPSDPSIGASGTSLAEDHAGRGEASAPRATGGAPAARDPRSARSDTGTALNWPEALLAASTARLQQNPGALTWDDPAAPAGTQLTPGQTRQGAEGGDRFLVRYLLTYFGIGVPAAAFAAALFRWLAPIEPAVGPRLAVGLGYALGSPAYPFTVSAFGHVPAAICLFCAFRLFWPRAPSPAVSVRSQYRIPGSGFGGASGRFGRFRAALVDLTPWPRRPLRGPPRRGKGERNHGPSRKSAAALPDAPFRAAGALPGIAPLDSERPGAPRDGSTVEGGETARSTRDSGGATANAVGPGEAWLPAAVAGVLLGCAVAFEYPAAVAALVVAVYGLVRARRRLHSAVGLALGAAPPLAGLALYHWLAFGAPWVVGYARLAPGTEYAAGQAAGFFGIAWPRPDIAAALLIGLKRGLLVHAPWLALAAAGAWLLWRGRRWRAEAACALAVFTALLLINSGYVFWEGGASWGARHLVPALPFAALLAVPAAGRRPRLGWLLVGASVLVTAAAVALRVLPEPPVAFPLADALAPWALEGRVTNNWGQLLGLRAWRGLVPAAAAVALLGAWVAGLRRSFGWLAATGWALAAVVMLDRSYLEYSEGYYLYLGARVAAGAALYAETPSTQPPGLPLLVALLWRVAPDVYLPRLVALACYVATALLAGRLALALSTMSEVRSPKSEVEWTPARRVGGRRPQTRGLGYTGTRSTGRASATALGPLATAMAALLPLGAGAPQVLDANAVLAPLAPALALLWLRARRERCARNVRWAVTAGALAAIGLSIKLTFVLFALAPVLAASSALLRSLARSRRGGVWLRGGPHHGGTETRRFQGNGLRALGGSGGVPVSTLRGGWPPHPPAPPPASRAPASRGEGEMRPRVGPEPSPGGGPFPSPLEGEGPGGRGPQRRTNQTGTRSVVRLGMLRLAAYGAAVAGVGGLHLAWWLARAGPAALDGLVGELESPVLPAGAALAVVQLLQLEGVPWALAAAGWWLVVRVRGLGSAAWFGLAAAAAPLYGLHQGTFVGVARPAEPFVAAFAALALVRLAETVTGWVPSRGRWRAPLRHPALAAGAAAALAIPAWHSALHLVRPPTVDPAGVVARIAQASPPDAEVLAPPYYAALAGRRMLFDYADWTVWGMRAAAGVERERRLADEAAALVDSGALPLVAADFRLAYLAPVRDALARRYVLAATDGDVPARSVAFFVPR